MLLLEKGKTWRREFLGLAALDGGLRLAGASAASLAALLLIDRAAPLSQDAREILLLGGLGAFAAGFYGLLIRPWRRLDWADILAAAARRFPELRDHLRTAWDLTSRPSSHTSEALKAAHLEQTEVLLRALPDKPVFPAAPSRWAKRGAAAVLCGGFALPWLGGGPAWQRVLTPWRDVPFESLASISPGDKTLEWGKPALIEVQWKAPADPDLKLWLRSAAGAWQSRPWDRSGRDGAAYAIEELTEPVQYRVALRDISSRVYRLSPAPVPQLVSLRAHLHSVAGASEVTLSPGEPVPVLRGGWLTIAGTPNQPLAKALLRVSSLPVPLPMKALAQGEYEAGFAVQEDASLQFELETPDGRKDARPPVYQLKAVADQAPKVELLSPLMPLQASPADTIPVAFSARDDIGLSRLSFLIRAPGLKDMEIVLRRFPRSQKEFLGDYSWELSALPPGLKAEFQLKALDNASPPQAGLSEVGTLEIVDFAAGHAAMESRWLKSQKELEALASREEEARDLAAAHKGEELQAKSAGLPEAWKEAAEGFSDLAQAMDKDVYANPGLTEQAKALSKDLSEARRETLPAAMKAAREGDLDRAAKQHGQLARELRKTQKLMKEGAKLQGIQDLYTEASRMSQSGAELEAALEAMSSKSAAKPSKEDVQKLQAALSRLQERMDSLRKVIESIPKPPPGPEDKARKAYTLPLEAARQVADLLQKAIADGDYAFAAKMAQALSENLAKIEKALSEAAMQQASAAAGPTGASERLEKAQALWAEASQAQSKDLENSQQIEQRKLSEMMTAQKDLLTRLAAEQRVVVSSAAALGVETVPHDALEEMKAALAEFESRKVEKASGELRAAAIRLRLEPVRRGRADPRAEALAAAEDAIRLELESAPQHPSEDKRDAQTDAAAAGQARTRGKTGKLQEELQSISEETGALPRQVLSRVEEALREQSAAEEALGRGDSAEALHHQENALSQLEQGGKESSQAMQSQKGIETGMGSPFDQPANGVRQAPGAGTGTGARLSHVTLPTARDYRPPQEIREELERSLKESRPASYDRVIKEYFKRIAQ